MAFQMKVIKGDITKLNVECIVNAANNQLTEGSGVCGAIYESAGWRHMQQACNSIGYCETGDAVITPGFNLPAKHVIHAVGPVYKDGQHNEPDLLKSAYLQSLRLAEDNTITSIAFPLLSTGMYHFPKVDAIKFAFEAIDDFKNETSGIIKDITICAYNDDDYTLINSVLMKRSVSS